MRLDWRIGRSGPANPKTLDRQRDGSYLMDDGQLERQGIAYRAWLNGRRDYYPHTLCRMAHLRLRRGRW